VKKMIQISLTDAERLFAARRTGDENQQAVAASAGFHQTAISKMEKGEIPVNPRLIKRFRDDDDLPDYIYLSLVRRRYQFKLAEAAVQCGIATHRLGDMERGRVDPDPAYVSWLESLMK